MHCSLALSFVLAAVSSVVAAPVKSTLTQRSHLFGLASYAKRDCSSSQMPNSVDMNVVKEIYQQVIKMSTDKKVAEIAIATCLTESDCNNLDCGDRKSHGPFQQQAPGFAWGTVADTMNVPVATKNFIDALMPIYKANPDDPVHVLCQKVQEAQAGDQYERSEDEATKLVDQMIAEFGSGGSGSDDSSSSSSKDTSTKTSSTKTSSTKTKTSSTETSTSTSDGNGAVNVGSDPNATSSSDDSTPSSTDTSSDPSSTDTSSSTDDGDDDDSDCDSSLPTCNAFATPAWGATCSSIATDNNITVAQFLQMNPSIDSDCQNMYAGRKYCVAADDI